MRCQKNDKNKILKKKKEKMKYNYWRNDNKIKIFR